MAKKNKALTIKLTIKQENFCNYYVETGNASIAYRKAYSCDRMKDKTINERSSRMLKEYKISTRVKELQDGLQQRSDITKDEAVKFLSHIVRANILDYVDVDCGPTLTMNEDEVSVNGDSQIVSIKDLSKLSKEQQRCIKSITQTKFGIRLELCEKDPALTRLAKMLGWDEPTRLSIGEDINQVTVFELPSNGRSKDK